MRYGEIIAVGSEIHTKHVNRLCGQSVEFVGRKAHSPNCGKRPLTSSCLSVWPHVITALPLDVGVLGAKFDI